MSSLLITHTSSSNLDNLDEISEDDEYFLKLEIYHLIDDNVYFISLDLIRVDDVVINSYESTLLPTFTGGIILVSTQSSSLRLIPIKPYELKLLETFLEKVCKLKKSSLVYSIPTYGITTYTYRIKNFIISGLFSKFIIKLLRKLVDDKSDVFKNVLENVIDLDFEEIKEYVKAILSVLE